MMPVTHQSCNIIHFYVMETLNALSARSLQFYVMAKHWASDLEFFKLESAFFDKLINEHFVHSDDVVRVEQVLMLTGKINRLKMDEEITCILLTEQLKQLELMAEDLIPEIIDNVKGKQVKLEYLVTNLTREFRQVKKELFSAIESIIKQNRLLA